jgi:hypothetical protein
MDEVGKNELIHSSLWKRNGLELDETERGGCSLSKGNSSNRRGLFRTGRAAPDKRPGEVDGNIPASISGSSASSAAGSFRPLDFSRIGTISSKFLRRCRKEKPLTVLRFDLSLG